MRINIGFIRHILSRRSIATIFAILLCIYFYPLEGSGGLSNVKVMVMGVTPLLFLFKAPLATRTLLLSILFWMVCLITALYNNQIRFSSLGYLGMFLMTFTLYDALLRNEAFTFPYFTRLLRFIIIAYGVCLVGQQLCLLIGIRNFSPLNLTNQFFLSIDKLPSLSREPSHAARILAVAYLCYLRCVQIVYGHKPSFAELFKGANKWCTLLFLWTMTTMGSGTAFICLGILTVYFVTWRNLIFTVPFFIGMYFVADAMEIKQLKRASKAVEVTTEMDANKIIAEDGSAAVRIAPLINTFTQTDLMDKTTWLGRGTSAKERFRMEGAKHGVLMQYGLIALIISLFIIYQTIIWSFWSVENLLAFGVFGLMLGNIDYIWGAYLLFAGSKYFIDRHRSRRIPIQEYEEVKAFISQKTGI